MPDTQSRSVSTAVAIRARRCEAEGRALVVDWESSGLTEAVFARRRGVSAQRLRYWRHRLKHADAIRPAIDVAFVEIPTPPVTSEVVLELGVGVQMRLARGFDPVLVRAVVSALSSPATGSVVPC